MLGKGSVNHNSRKFKATNIDSERTQNNIEYCNIPIKKVYSELFDDAVKRYNEKQTRSDRCIDNYYDKIRTGKQEKLFYEVILQIGNKDNMSACYDDGKLAAKVLDEYMSEFQNRNPNLHVFSAHLHMDEATPHLHIDFVPFTTGSKRGLDTRVSLKQALSAQGFHGGSRSETEWNQWVKSEKEQLSIVMKEYGIEWEQLGTHDEHLSVVDYKKVQRIKEVIEIENLKAVKQKELSALETSKITAEKELDGFIAKTENAQKEIKTIKDKEKFIAQNARHYDDNPEYELPEPKPMMTTKSYRDKIAFPLVNKLKDVIRRLLLQYFEKTRSLQTALDRATDKIKSLTKRIEKLEPENERLRIVEQEFNRVRHSLGDDYVKTILEAVKNKKPIINKERIIKKESRNTEISL